MAKLIVAFRNFANQSKWDLRDVRRQLKMMLQAMQQTALALGIALGNVRGSSSVQLVSEQLSGDTKS